jgi:hypothetical protein
VEGRTNLLIHLFDKEVLDLYATPQHPNSVIQADIGAALKIAWLFCPGQLLLPLSSYFESAYVAPFIDQWASLFEAQELQLVSSELDYEVFAELKRDQYKREPHRHPTYYDKKVVFKLRDLTAPISRRNRSSTQDIGTGWREHFTNDQGIITGLAKVRNEDISQFKRALVELPQRLGGDAFIWDYVKPLLPVSSVDSDQTHAIKALISRYYVRSYLDEFDAYAIHELRVGDFGCGLRSEELQSIRRMRQIVRRAGIAEGIGALTWDDVLLVRDVPIFVIFAQQLRSLMSLRQIPVNLLRGLEAARYKIPEGRTKEHVIRAAEIIAQELTASGIYDLDAAPLGRWRIGHSLSTKIDWDQLFAQLVRIAPGRDDAHDYERVIEKLLTALFHPVLIDPEVQVKLHEGRKRVDITFTNRASEGFFDWLAKHYLAPYIYVECKNYAREMGNPELDQLAGRFSRQRGQCGLLICRNIEDLASLMKRCCDKAVDDQGFIIPLDDDDLKALIDQRKACNDTDFFNLPLFKRRFDQLVRRSP